MEDTVTTWQERSQTDVLSLTSLSLSLLRSPPVLFRSPPFLSKSPPSAVTPLSARCVLPLSPASVLRTLKVHYKSDRVSSCTPELTLPQLAQP